MKQTSSSKQLPASDEAPRLTAGDLARATLRVGGQEVSRDAFATAVQGRLGEQLETTLRRVIRDELHTV